MKSILLESTWVWHKQLQNVFSVILVLRYMVATGKPTSGNGQKTEIVDLTDSSMSCVLDDIPSQWGSTGGVLGTTPIICGGFNGNYLNECLLHGTSDVITMNSKRLLASSVVINPNKIWILGGSDGSNVLDSTEFVTLEGTEIGPTLPEAVSGACAVKLPDTGDVYSIGGYGSSGNTNNVWVANAGNGYTTFSQGPSLMTYRESHACGTMSIGAKSIIVAAGGYNYNDSNYHYLSSVEILDPLSNQWVAGK